MRNSYTLLRELLPEPPLQVGTVQAVADGVARILLPGGGMAHARGEATVGQHVFFKNEVIEGQASDLPIEVIEI